MIVGIFFYEECERMTEGRVGNSIVGLQTSDDSTASIAARHTYLITLPSWISLIVVSAGGRYARPATVESPESGFFGLPRSDWTKGDISWYVLTVRYGLQVNSTSWLQSQPLTARFHCPQSIRIDCGDMTYLRLRLEVKA
jgi:hypothetical protein